MAWIIAVAPPGEYEMLKTVEGLEVEKLTSPAKMATLGLDSEPTQVYYDVNARDIICALKAADRAPNGLQGQGWIIGAMDDHEVDHLQRLGVAATRMDDADVILLWGGPIEEDAEPFYKVLVGHSPLAIHQELGRYTDEALDELVQSSIDETRAARRPRPAGAR